MARGYPTKTPERDALRLAQGMRRDGKTGQEIATVLGVARQTAYAWMADPDGSVRRALVDTYCGACRSCGVPTTGCHGHGKAPMLCGACSHAATWTPDRLLTEARRWRALVGRWPASTEWRVTALRTTLGVSRGFIEAIVEFRALTGPWPTSRSVQDRFGSWEAFMRALDASGPGTSRGIQWGQRERELRNAIARCQTEREAQPDQGQPALVICDALALSPTGGT